MALAIVSLFALATVVHSWSAPFSNQYLIDADTQYKFYWDADENAGVMRVGLEKNGIGWVGFGISSTGGMVGSDVFIAYIYSNSTTVLNDRLATAKQEPGKDVDFGGVENWNLLSSSRTGTAMTIEASRSFSTGDSRDLDFVSGSMKLVFSYYTGDPDDSDFFPLHQHDQPFPQTLTLFGTGDDSSNELNTTGFPSDYQNFSIRFPDHLLSTDQTTYMCVGTILANSSGPAQAIAFEPVVVAKNNVHHFVLYGCDSDHSGAPFECASMPSGCIQVMWAWAVGGNIFYTPSNVGFLFGVSPFRYVVLQVHYDNSAHLANQYDSSGVNIYYTYTLRQYTAGFIRLGHSQNTIQLPPKEHAFTIGGICDSDKTSLLPASGIYVFASFLHMHKLGRKIYTTHTLQDGTPQKKSW